MSNPYLSPFFKIMINSKPISPQQAGHIKDIEIDNDIQGSDTCRISLADPNFVYIDDDIFVEDTPIYVEIGVNEINKPTKFSGYISFIDITFSEEGIPHLVLNCMDESHVMNRKPKKRSWDKATRAETASRLSSEYGFKIEKEPNYVFKREDTITQSGQTDLEFLESLASEEKVPFQAKLYGKVFKYKRLNLTKPSDKVLKYRETPYDIINVDLRVNKEVIKEESKKGDVNSKDKKVELSSTSNEKGDKGTIASKGGASTNSGKKYTYNTKTGKWE